MNFIDLVTQQKLIIEKINKNILKVLKHGKYINGPEVKEIENILSEYVGVNYAVGCASGTDALLMSLMAYEVGQGDAVFTTPFTFIATAEVIKLLQARPVFVDIDPETYNIDTEKLEFTIENILNKGEYIPRGIIPVNLFGQPADYDEINRLAQKYNLFVLEDAAQSFGAIYKGKKSCSLSDIAATSFFPAKPLGCYGDGGMIFTNDKKIYEKLASIRMHGKGDNKYDNVRLGINGRLDTIQAGILIAKFEIFEREISLRQKVSKKYSEELKDVCKIPCINNNNVSSWAQYSIIHTEREKIINYLKQNGVPTAIYYPKPLHLQKTFSQLGYSKGDFLVSEEVSSKIFSIPMHPYLTISDQNKIISAIRAAIVS